MHDDIRPAKSPPSLALTMQILNFSMNLNSQSSNDEKNTNLKITRKAKVWENVAQTRLGGEFWACYVIAYKAYWETLF